MDSIYQHRYRHGYIYSINVKFFEQIFILHAINKIQVFDKPRIAYKSRVTCLYAVGIKLRIYIVNLINFKGFKTLWVGSWNVNLKTCTILF